MNITKIMTESDAISELYLSAAEIQLNRFCKQMPRCQCIDADNKYTTHLCSGIGYTFGGTIVGLPNLVECERVLYTIYQRHHGRISSIIQDAEYISLSHTATVSPLYETSDILRLNDGELVGIRAQYGHYNLVLSPFIYDKLILDWNNYWIRSLQATNASIWTEHPDWIISSVLWFDKEQR